MLSHEDFDEVMDVVICKEMGWTLEYIENLGAAKRAKVEAVLNGLNEGMAK